MFNLIGEAIGEFALYAIAWGLVALAALSFAFYPRETLAVAAGVVVLALWGAVLVANSWRTKTPMPKGRLTAAAVTALGVVILVFSYGYPFLDRLPGFQ